MRGLIIVFSAFFAYIANSMIAAMYGLLSLDFIIAFQLIVNPRKTRILHLIDTRNQNQFYGIYCSCLYELYYTCIIPEAHHDTCSCIYRWSKGH